MKALRSNAWRRLVSSWTAALGGAAMIVLVLLAPGVSGQNPHGTGNPSDGGSSIGSVVLGLGRSGTPFAFTRDGEPRGFELDLARALADEMEVELTVRWLPRNELLHALRRGEVDIVNVGAMSGGPPADVDVVPHLLVGEHALVRHDNPFAIRAGEDLSGTMVVATMATPGEEFARELGAEVDTIGKAPVQVHTMPMAQYTPVAVLYGHASAYFAPTAAAALQTAHRDAWVKVVPGLFKPTGRLSFGLRIADAELGRNLRSALARVVAKGVYGRLLATYHLPEDSSPFR